jgi:hypothetical protein
MKTIHAKYKKPIEAAISLSELVDFNKNWIEAASVVEATKRRLFEEMKSQMHERIAEMTLEDIEFKILP